MSKTDSDRYSKDFSRPDEIRDFKSHGHFEVLKFDDGTTVGRGVFKPGWKWSNDVKPIVGTSSCQSPHIGICMSGSMTIRMNSGEEFELQAGSVFDIPAGHDAWVNGNQECVWIDVANAKSYAKKSAA